MLMAEHVCKSVPLPEGRLEILCDINLEVAAGESLAITGASGSGKSTLLGILAGLDTATSGKVVLANQTLSDMDEEQRAAVRAEYVGFVFQSFQLLPGLTALENVCLPLELHGRSGESVALATEFLAAVGLEKRLQYLPRQLSGGEQQRVAIARAFVTQPQILFADEPTGNLDAGTGQAIIEQLFRMNEEYKTTLVFVTHEERLAKLCHRRIEVDAGRLLDGAGLTMGQ